MYIKCTKIIKAVNNINTEHIVRMNLSERSTGIVNSYGDVNIRENSEKNLKH